MNRLPYQTIAIAVMLSSGAVYLSAETLGSRAEQVVVEAKKVQLEAKDISTALRSRATDMAKVKEMMANLERHVESVDQLVKDLGTFEGEMTAAQKMRYEAVKMKAQLLTVFTTNKKSVLEGEDAAKNRRLLRAKADGIAQRAQMMQESAMALR